MAIDLGFLAQAGMRGLAGYRQGQRLAREDEQEEARNLFAEWARRQQLALQGRAIDVDQQRLNMPPTPRTQAVQGPDGNYTVIDLNRVGPTGVSGRMPNPPAPLRGQVVQDASGKYVVVDPTKIGPTNVTGRLPGQGTGGAAPGSRAPTEGQSKDYLFWTMVRRGNANMERVREKIRPEAVTAYLSGAIFKPALTPEEQLFVQGAREYASGVLRKETGAAVQREELLDVMRRYIDAGLDDPTTREAKRQARAEIEATLQKMASPAASFYDKPRRPLNEIMRPPE